MKKYLLSTLIIFISLSLLSQSCLPEGITFSTQEQIDNFQTENPGCTEIEGDVTISGSDITNLNGLNVINNIEGSLIVDGNEDLVSLGGLESLNTIGGILKIKSNDNLVNLNGLDSLTFIQGDLIIGEIGAWFIGEGNPSLLNFDGINNLTSVGGNVQIVSNDNLLNLNGLNGLTSITGDLKIFGNGNLINLNGLDNLLSIQGDLQIGVAGHKSNRSNPSLLNLDGLNNLTLIGGDLLILENYSLSSLTGLMGVTSIGGSLSVWYSSVTNLNGLNNIDANTISGLCIAWNESLSLCEVQSICDYLLAPVGTIEIHNNATGCDSQQELEEACETVSIDEVSLTGNITTSPNPFTTSTTLSYDLQRPEKVTLTIYNHLGQLVYQTHEYQQKGTQQFIWNAEGYADGIYYYRLQVGDAVANGKIVKVQ